jgi:drug/metabolite transporter (DMT)-like permease
VATPVIALLVSTLFEGYRWTWVAGLGVLLAVLGNWLALRPAPETAAPRDGTPTPAAASRPR